MTDAAAPGCLAYELAVGAFFWWRDVRPQTAEVIERMTVPVV